MLGSLWFLLGDWVGVSVWRWVGGPSRPRSGDGGWSVLPVKVKVQAVSVVSCVCG